MIEIGQVIWLKFRFNNKGDVSDTKHPYLIIDIDDTYNTVEIAQIDLMEGKMFKPIFKSNKILFCTMPTETVIKKDGFVQLDNSFKVENYPELEKYLNTNDKLSKAKLDGIIDAYKEYHKQNAIDENKTVYMDKVELENLNK